MAFPIVVVIHVFDGRRALVVPHTQKGKPISRPHPLPVIVCQHLGTFGIRALQVGTPISLTVAVGRAFATRRFLYRKSHDRSTTTISSTTVVLPVFNEQTDLSLHAILSTASGCHR